jgi:hypothetical protein
MLDIFCPIPKCRTTHLSYHRFLVMELLVPTKNNQSQGQRGHSFQGPTPGTQLPYYMQGASYLKRLRGRLL